MFLPNKDKGEAVGCQRISLYSLRTSDESHSVMLGAIRTAVECQVLPTVKLLFLLDNVLFPSRI